MRNADTVALIKHNLQKAKDSIIQAGALLNIQQYFGAVNRAYYAIFYAALAILLTKDLGSSKNSGVLSLFNREFVKINEIDKKWSKIFHDAFGLRATGDYAKLADVTVSRQLRRYKVPRSSSHGQGNGLQSGSGCSVTNTVV